MLNTQTTRNTVLGGIAVALAFATTPVNAALVTFTGSDPGAGSLATAPNSVAAAANFDAAAALLGSEHIITFESSPLGTFASLNPAPGVTVTGADISGGNQTIVNTSLCSNALCGYNTTVGGSRFLQLFGGTATFSFSPGTSAFGAYLTGVQLVGETITFNDGSNQSVAIPNPGGSGGTDFVGFTDATKSIASITITVLNDIIGVDDVRYVGPSSSPVPEPASLSILGAAMIGFALRRRNRSA
jgi:hypothetical protein